MGVGILAKRVVLELGFSTNFVYSLKGLPQQSFLILFFSRSSEYTDDQNKRSNLSIASAVFS